MQQAPPRPAASHTPESCRASHPYRLVSREMSAEYSDGFATRPVQIGSATVGGKRPTVIAGPCAVESREQTLDIAHAVKAAGAELLRGGAFKPRTSPYDFQGLGEAGLEILAEARAATGLPIVTEVLDVRDVPLVAQYADCLQLGARNMQNFALLSAAGAAGLPVLLKRHWAAPLSAWLCAAEHAAVEGNLDIVLCERGIRTFSQGDYNRNTLDLNVVPAVRRQTFLPILVDPSHGTGEAELVPAACLAGLGVGADGLLVEVIGESTLVSDTLCDGHQSIRPSVLADIIETARHWRRQRTPTEAGGGTR